MSRSPIIVGIDTGGTFTDFILLHRGRISVDKRPSFPRDPVRVIRAGVLGFLRSIDAAGSAREADASKTDDDDALLARHGADLVIIHGTTVPTNALLEGKTARTCLITNKGFEDIVEIGRQERLDLFRLPVVKAVSPVPRALRIGVDQRTMHDGSEELALTEEEIDAAVARAGRTRAAAAAVCLLYSFLDSGPEERLGRALRRAGLATSLSSRIAPEFREYERTTTTVINASLKPVMESYLTRLEAAFAGAEILVMGSSGGVAPPVEMAERPVSAILSGPAGGVAGAAALLSSEAAAAGGARGRYWGRATPGGASDRAGEAGLAARRAITFDMGGTSTDVALIDGEPLRRHQSAILGLPLLVPSVDIHTVGAGGGSKIWIDRGGALRVGPESTGAEPGPACYGRALIPALTDAHLVLGRLDGRGLLGGGFAVDVERSAQALDPLAKQLGVTPEDLAGAVLDVADAVVEKAIRVITLGSGRDPRDYPLVAFGGAGGLHACRLMQSMGLPAVIIPPNPGVLSAAGIATAELREERARGLPLVLQDGAPAKLKSAFERIEAEWRRERQVTEHVTVRNEVDLRYTGQSFQLTLPYNNGRSLAKRFHALHLEQYGHCDQQAPIEVVTIRTRFRKSRGVRAARVFRSTVGDQTALSGRLVEPEEQGRLRAHPRFGQHSIPLFVRASLEPGHVVRGPAVITEYSATTVVEGGCAATISPAMSLIIGRD